MKFPSLLGWALLVTAFFTAAAETVVHAVPGVSGAIISAYDLWYTFSPKGLVVARITIERSLHPIFWDPLLVTFLKLPAWLFLASRAQSWPGFSAPPAKGGGDRRGLHVPLRQAGGGRQGRQYAGRASP